MTPTELRTRLHAGDTGFGTLVVSPSPRWPEVLKTCGLFQKYLPVQRDEMRQTLHCARRSTVPDDPLCPTIHCARRSTVPDDPLCPTIHP